MYEVPLYGHVFTPIEAMTELAGSSELERG